MDGRNGVRRCSAGNWQDGAQTAIARFHNVYGPYERGMEAVKSRTGSASRKVIERRTPVTGDPIWGERKSDSQLMYIDDCVKGIDMIMHCDELIATPINLGSSHLVSINDLVTLIEEIAGVRLNRHYDMSAPRGVAGRNSDNSFIKATLGWEPDTPLEEGMRQTYAWIKEQYEARKAGEHTPAGTSDGLPAHG